MRAVYLSRLGPSGLGAHETLEIRVELVEVKWVIVRMVLIRSNKPKNVSLDMTA